MEPSSISTIPRASFVWCPMPRSWFIRPLLKTWVLIVVKSTPGSTRSNWRLFCIPKTPTIGYLFLSSSSFVYLFLHCWSCALSVSGKGRGGKADMESKMSLMESTEIGKLSMQKCWIIKVVIRNIQTRLKRLLVIWCKKCLDRLS